MDKMWFTDFGFLEWLEPKDYYMEAWRYVGTERDDEENEEYDIVEMDGDYRYTNI